MENKKIIAIIPARGGSKGIPRKNIKILASKPLIAWTIEAAKNSKYLDRVIVSTEDEEIAEISKKYGAEVVERPEELATDASPTGSVIEQVIAYLEQNESYNPDAIVLLQPTSPLRFAHHIGEAVKTFLEGGYDSLVGVSPSHVFIWRMEEEDYSLHAAHVPTISLTCSETRNLADCAMRSSMRQICPLWNS